jgi:hypothetical protein
MYHELIVVSAGSATGQPKQPIKQPTNQQTIIL